MDLEFVTEPFANEEKEDILLAIETIEKACDSLSELAEEHKKNKYTITFATWMKNLQSLKESRFCFESLEDFDLVKLSSIQLNENFFAEFQPQVTIQHHLEDTINLTMGLFAEDTGTGEKEAVVRLSDLDKLTTAADVIKKCFQPNNANNPNWDNITPTYYTEDDSLYFPRKTSKEYGFFFLHMMICHDLARSSKEPEKGIEIIHNDVFKKTGQINPKSYIHLVSRRPYSSMWMDILLKEDYSDFARRQIGDASHQYLVNAFKNLNYGAYYEQDICKAPCLESLSGSQKEQIRQLLGKGAISTSMLLMGNPEIFSTYFDDMLKSINAFSAQPARRFVMSAQGIEEKETHYDLISPPYFIPDSDSLGAYKDNKHDKHYGEAIVEFRDILSISKKAYDKISNNKYILKLSERFLQKNFLDEQESEKKEYRLREQVEGLLSYIENLLRGDKNENQ